MLFRIWFKIAYFCQKKRCNQLLNQPIWSTKALKPIDELRIIIRINSSLIHWIIAFSIAYIIIYSQNFDADSRVQTLINLTSTFSRPFRLRFLARSENCMFQNRRMGTCSLENFLISCIYISKLDWFIKRVTWHVLPMQRFQRHLSTITTNLRRFRTNICDIAIDRRRIEINNGHFHLQSFSKFYYISKNHDKHIIDSYMIGTKIENVLFQ